MWIVRVGADNPDLARADSVDCCGNNYHGPFTTSEAHAFIEKVNAAWADVPRDCFFYGPPQVEMLSLINDWSAERAARNWHADTADVT